VASVSLKRIADGPTGLPRYFWLAVEPAKLPSPAEKLDQIAKARTWELEESTKSKTKFLNTVSHEMRTPLCGIIGSLSLLEDTQLTPEQRQILRVAGLCGDQLLVLINDVLDKAKLDAGMLVLEKLPFALHDLLADSLEMMATFAAQKGIELILDILPGIPLEAIGDPFRLRQIFLNLVSNACKFTKEGHVLLRASLAPAAKAGLFVLRILVEDTGIGMSHSVRQQLFQPFSQADQSTSRQFGGTGLGLSIAQHLAHLMAGNITVDSKEGVGSKFFAEVTLATSDNPDLEHIPFHVYSQVQLLLVVRNVALRDILSRQLGDWSFQLVAVGTSTEALALKALERFSVLVADINGRPDDVNLLQRFNMPTILLRQSGEEERLRKALTKSPHRILVSKPVRAKELHDALSLAMGRLQSAVEPVPSTPRQHERRSLRVLLAEDNVTNQLIIDKMLRRLGQSNVTTVSDGQLAVDACRTTYFDVIFMDIMMPELNGWEATAQIRELPAGRRVFVVALTATSSSEDRQKCLEAGMDRIITKPISPQELADGLEAATQAYMTSHNPAAEVSA
jgi:signal transduction histidine kinase/CheY-like chemotaxis protein